MRGEKILLWSPPVGHPACIGRRPFVKIIPFRLQNMGQSGPQGRPCGSNKNIFTESSTNLLIVFDQLFDGIPLSEIVTINHHQIGAIRISTQPFLHCRVTSRSQIVNVFFRCDLRTPPFTVGFPAVNVTVEVHIGNIPLFRLPRDADCHDSGHGKTPPDTASSTIRISMIDPTLWSIRLQSDGERITLLYPGATSKVVAPKYKACL